MAPLSAALFSVARASTPLTSPSGASFVTRASLQALSAAVRKPPHASCSLTNLTNSARRMLACRARLTRAEAIIDVQKKVAHLLGTSLPSLPNDEL